MRHILTVIFACLLFAQTLNAQTTLGPGDIAFVAMNTDGATDEFGFVLLKDIVATTTITFTDYQWLTTGGFDAASLGGACNSETTMTWTASTDMSLGTIVYIYNPGAAGVASEATATAGTIVPVPSNCPDFSFPPSGEALYAYQGTRPTSNSATNFLAAINMDGAWLTGDSPTTSGGAAPPLTSGQMIVVTPEVDNAALKCSVLPLTGTASEIRAIVSNLSNWDTDNTTQYTLPRPDCASPPVITTTGTLSAFSTCGGTASAAQNFTVSGSDLTANLTVTAPTGFEVSTSSGSGYAGSLNLSPSSGTVSTTTIYVRITAAASGSPSGNVACTSTDATTKNVGASGTVTAPTTWYQDSDSDGFGNAGVSQSACVQPGGYVANSSDCNDAQLRYQDNDGDDFGSSTLVACGGVTNNSDCNDAQLRYLDGDSDTYGSSTFVACGGVLNNTDCNDADGTINPGATEICGNGVDEDCAGGDLTCEWDGSESTDWSVAGNWGSNAIPGANAAVSIPSGPSNQPHITTGTGTPTQVGDLTIGNGATLTVDAGKALTVNGDLTNSGTVIVKADASAIGSLITFGTVSGTGDFQMEQYLTGSGGGTPDGVFYYVSSPVVGATAATFNVAAGNKLWAADEASLTYPQITFGATGLNTTTGFIVRRGTTGTVTYDGTTFNTGNQTANGLTRTGTTELHRGYNLVGNPYSSTVNWTTADRTNLEPTIWYRTHNGSTMLFDTYNLEGSGLGTNNNGNGEVSNLIPPTQAFWVRVAADGQTGSLSFDNADRSHGSWSSIYRLAAEEGTVRIKLGNGTISDEAIIHFNTEALDARDTYDSEKMWADAIPQLYTSVGADSLVINGLYSVETNPIVDLGIKAPTTGDYTITASSITLNEEVWLEDRALSTFQHLNVNPVYAFTTNSGNIGDRFALHFGMMAVGIGRDVACNVCTHVFAADGIVNVSVGNDITTGIITILDMAGRTVQTAVINGSRTVVATDLTTGIYLVRVETAQGAETHRVMLR